MVNRIHRKVTASRTFHPEASVISVSGKKEIIITAGTDQIINIYNLKTTVFERELNFRSYSFTNVHGVAILGGGEKEMVVADEFYGLTWLSYDLAKAEPDYPELGFKPVMNFFDFVSPDKNIFAACNDKGVIKVFYRTSFEDENEVAVDIQPLRKFIGHKGKVNAMSHFKDGSYISAGSDGTYRIWTSRRDVIKVGKVDAGKGGCCGTK